MQDIRLQEAPFELDGKTYILKCTFNTLADIQDEYGEIPDIQDERKTLPSVRIFLAAMVNDYADEQGWPERFTPKQIGRKIPVLDFDLIKTVTRLILTAMFLEKEGQQQPEGNPKN